MKLRCRLFPSHFNLLSLVYLPNEIALCLFTLLNISYVYCFIYYMTAAYRSIKSLYVYLLYDCVSIYEISLYVYLLYEISLVYLLY